MNQNLPRTMELDAGTHYWCSCGKSATAPLCDGSHAGTDCVPIEFVLTERKKVSLCTCRRTQQAPFCDGTHARV